MPPGLHRLPLRPAALAYRPAYHRYILPKWRSPTATTSRTLTSSTPKTNPSDPAEPTNLHPKPHTSPSGADHPSSHSPVGAAPNTQQAPHVSEEASAMAKSMGNENSGPDMSQGTAVGYAVKNDSKEMKESLPKVMKDAMAAGESKKPGDPDAGAKGSKRQFSTWARRPFSTAARQRIDQQTDLSADSLPPSMTSSPGQPPATREEQAYPGQYFPISAHEARLIALGQAPDPLLMQQQVQMEEQEASGLKFPPPTEEALVHSGFGRHGAAKANANPERRTRYDTVVDQVTNLIMKHGKKARAQRDMQTILTHLRLTPPPSPQPSLPQNPKRLLPLPPSTPLSSLPHDPILYLTHAIDSLSPLMVIRSHRGLAGGGQVTQIPSPLSQRARRRTAIVWLMEAAVRKKGAPGAGFAKRFAEEVVAALEGRSAAWEKRVAVHRLGTSGRANLMLGGKTRRRV